MLFSVSCIYGMGNPDDYYNGIILNQNLKIDRQILIKSLVNAFYSRTTETLERGTLEQLEIMLTYIHLTQILYLELNWIK